MNIRDRFAHFLFISTRDHFSYGRTARKCEKNRILEWEIFKWEKRFLCLFAHFFFFFGFPFYVAGEKKDENSVVNFHRNVFKFRDIQLKPSSKINVLYFFESRTMQMIVVLLEIRVKQKKIDQHRPCNIKNGS